MKKQRSTNAETERMVLGLCAYAMYCYTNGSAQHAYTLLKECEQLLGGAEPPSQRLVH
jgi:hypothetical protein